MCEYIELMEAEETAASQLSHIRRNNRLFKFHMLLVYRRPQKKDYVGLEGEYFDSKKDVDAVIENFKQEYYVILKRKMGAHFDSVAMYVSKKRGEK